MNYAIVQNGVYIEQCPPGNVEWDATHFCPASALSEAERTQFHVVPLIETSPPGYVPLGQVCQRAGATLQNGEWYMAWELVALPLEEQRTLLLAEVAKMRVYVQRAGKAYTFPDGAGTIQTRDAIDLINVNGRVTAALVLQAQGVTDPVLEFRDAENVTHAMTPIQMIEMGMAASQFVSATYAAKWAHDTAVSAWDGAIEYDIAAGWPA